MAASASPVAADQCLMPTVESTAAPVVANGPSASPPSSPDAAAGFADALARADGATASRQGTVTLGQMIGLAPAPPAPIETPGLQTLSAPSAPDASSTVGEAGSHPALEAASAYLGVPYKWGGTSASTGFDCSGFVQQAFDDIGVRLPRVSADQARAGEPVASLAQAKPGDLVYWSGRGGSSNHIGIYMGEGKMMHAPRTGDVVKVDDVRSAPPTTIRRVA